MTTQEAHKWVNAFVGCVAKVAAGRGCSVGEATDLVWGELETKHKANVAAALVVVGAVTAETLVAS